MILHMEAVAGMVMQPDVVYSAYKSIQSKDAKVIYMTPQGKKLDQKKVEDLSKEKHLIILCGSILSAIEEIVPFLSGREGEADARYH